MYISCSEEGIWNNKTSTWFLHEKTKQLPQALAWVKGIYF
jgi:hypothetical protein